MTWQEIDGTDWVLPAPRNKTKVELVRPLSAAAQGVLARVPRLALAGAAEYPEGQATESAMRGAERLPVSMQASAP